MLTAVSWLSRLFVLVDVIVLVGDGLRWAVSPAYRTRRRAMHAVGQGERVTRLGRAVGLVVALVLLLVVLLVLALCAGLIASWIWDGVFASHAH